MIRCPNCHSSSIVYKFSSNKFQIYFCNKCLNGFTYPVPKNMNQYYSDSYWLPKGFLGVFKNTIYRFFQMRRKYWIQKYLKKGEILDVGSGEATFSSFFKKDFHVTCLDVPSAKIKNPNVLKVNFLSWNTEKRFDAVVFWESLEHTSCPQKYIRKAYTLLKPEGYIFIECPRFNCFEARFFKKYWFHLDPPRHLVHLTPNSLNKLLFRTKLTLLLQSSVLAPEYTIGGFVESILNLFLSKPNDFLKNFKNSFLLPLLIPLLIISTIVEIILFILGESPIYLTIAKKKGGLLKS